jgi:NAD-dependent SIR2 family protein deacetylase
VQGQEFAADPAARRRYWSRSILGWPHFSAARPNAAHHALAALESLGTVTTLITQNVDGLHQ